MDSKIKKQNNLQKKSSAFPNRKKPLRILFVNQTMNLGGIETFLMTLTKELLEQGNEVAFLCYKEGTYFYEKEITKIGCKLYKLHEGKNTPHKKHFDNIRRIIREYKPDVVHSCTYVDSIHVMLAALLSGVKCRVTHSHTSEKPSELKQTLKWPIAKVLFKILATDRIACSKEAGKQLFAKNDYVVIKNGVDIKEFQYDPIARKTIRSKLNIKENEYVIGHIGRFHKVKNHTFIIDVFAKILEKNKDCKLMLVGDGTELNNIKLHISKKKIPSNKVILTGAVDNPSFYCNAMDTFIFPSFYEGLPMALVEAGTNGLRVTANSVITRDAIVNNNITFLSLDDDIDIWANTVIASKRNKSPKESLLAKSEYNIKNTARTFEKLYRRRIQK